MGAVTKIPSDLKSAIKGLFVKHLPPPKPPSIKKHIWSEGWTANSTPEAVAAEMIQKFSPCYTDLSVLHLPMVYDSTTDAGKMSISVMTGLVDPQGPSRYFFLGIVLEGVRLAAPGQKCLWDSEF